MKKRYSEEQIIRAIRPVPRLATSVVSSVFRQVRFITSAVSMQAWR